MRRSGEHVRNVVILDMQYDASRHKLWGDDASAPLVARFREWTYMMLPSL